MKAIIRIGTSRNPLRDSSGGLFGANQAFAPKKLR